MGLFNAIDEVVGGWVAVAPRGNAAERELMRLHNEWLTKECQIGRLYYATAATITWAFDYNDNAFEFCDLKWEFERFDKRRTHAITTTGHSSVQVFAWACEAAGGQLTVGEKKKLLTTTKPPVPPKPMDTPFLHGDLRKVW